MQNYLNLVYFMVIVDWEAITGVDKVPCPAGELFEGYDPGEDRVSDNGTEVDAGDFVVC